MCCSTSISSKAIWYAHLNLGLFPLHVFLFEFWQEAVPILIGQLRVLGKLSLDHERLNVVDRVNVLYAVLHNTPDLLQAHIWPHAGDSIALNQDVALCQELKRFQSSPIWTDKALSSLDKLFLRSA